MDSTPLPNENDACHQLIAKLQSQVGEQATEVSLKDKQIEEQAHSVLELKAESDRLEEKNVELNLKLEKLLKQLYGRRSERRVDGEGQLFLNLGQEPTPEAEHQREHVGLLRVASSGGRIRLHGQSPPGRTG